MANVDPHINPNTGVWDDNWFAQHYGNQSSGGGGGTDFNAILKAQQQAQTEANKPIIENLQQQLPLVGQQIQQTQKTLETGQQKLEATYKNLVDSITGNQQQETQSAQTATSTELGRRGVSSMGGLYDQTINKAVSPITRYYTNQLQGAGNTFMSENQDIQNQIAGLPLQQTQQELQIRQLMAQAQAGGNTTAIQNALALWQNQQAQSQAAEAAKIKAANDLLLAQSQNNPMVVGENSYVYDPATGTFKSPNQASGLGTGTGGGAGGDDGFTPESPTGAPATTLSNSRTVLGLTSPNETIQNQYNPLLPNWVNSLYYTGK